MGNELSVTLVASDGSFEVWSPWSPLSADTFAMAAWPVDAETAYVLTSGGRVVRTSRGETIEDVLRNIACAGDNLALAEPASSGATALSGRTDALVIGFSDGEIRTVGFDGVIRSTQPSGLGAVSALSVCGDVTAASDADRGWVAILGGGEGLRLEGFDRPTGVALWGEHLFIAEHGRRRILRCGLDGSDREVVASSLPFGVPNGGRPTRHGASLMCESDGALVVGFDGDASIRRLRNR